MGYRVSKVEKNSIAFEVGIAPGDEIVDFNNQEFIDIIDYIYFASKKRLSIGYINKNDEPIKAIIRKDEEEHLGLEFEKDLLGESRSCGNGCIFCFVDQLPDGMRKSLYHKDEDWRYSFIYGNYVTLARLSNKDLKRIKRRKISHLFISVHAVENELRAMMLGNKKARPIKPLLKAFARSGITMHTQIVLCRGINDGDHLKKSYDFLKDLYPHVQSVSVIPVGLTGHREGLYPLSDITKIEAENIIKVIEKWQEECRSKIGTGFVYASDEMYLKAKMDIPSAEKYDGFPQIENGVGLVAKFEQEFYERFNSLKDEKPKFRKSSLVTASAFYPFVKKYLKEIEKRFNIEIKCYKAQNVFFGGKIDVAGLLTSSDIIKVLKDKELGEALYISSSLLRENENVLLDNVSVKDLSNSLACEIIEIPVLGDKFLESFLNK
jgi:putative radical SAM enzyme (TIGR03279 family)